MRTKRTKRAKRQQQLAVVLAERKRGGRPKTGKAIGLPHRSRPFHDRNHPVHVTWRFQRGLPSMRNRKLATAIGRTVRGITQSHAKRQTAFRVVHFSIQSTHMHLIVEAKSQEVLSRGLQGLGIWIARRVNAVLDASGRVLADRFHGRPLTTPREVRNCIVYVLQNHKHHERSGVLVDAWSSAPWFDGWEKPWPSPATPTPVALPLTWLASTGWRKHGLIGFDEEPAS